MPNLNLYVESNNPEELSRLLQLVLGCAVNCERKSEFIKVIMEMPVDSQHMIMTAIQEVFCLNLNFVGSLMAICAKTKHLANDKRCVEDKQ